MKVTRTHFLEAADEDACYFDYRLAVAYRVIALMHHCQDDCGILVVFNISHSCPGFRSSSVLPGSVSWGLSYSRQQRNLSSLRP